MEGIDGAARLKQRPAGCLFVNNSSSLNYKYARLPCVAVCCQGTLFPAVGSIGNLRDGFQGSCIQNSGASTRDLGLSDT